MSLLTLTVKCRFLFSIANKSPLEIFHSQVRYLNANTASITNISRKMYAKMYPCMMVLADGSTINFRYQEPRRIITMPLDLSTLSEAECLARIERRKPKQKVKIEEDFKDTFNAKKYLSYTQNKASKKK